MRTKTSRGSRNSFLSECWISDPGSPAVYMRADTRRNEKSMKNIATNFQEHRVPRSDFNLKLLLLLLLL